MSFYNVNWITKETSPSWLAHQEEDLPNYRISSTSTSTTSSSSSAEVTQAKPLRGKNYLKVDGNYLPGSDKPSSNVHRKKHTKKTNNNVKYVHVPHKDKPPQVVAKRNARERRRVQAVNSAFVKLRKAVPFDNNRGKRISKVKTLQYAIDYIQKLQDILNMDEYNPQHIQYPYNYYHNPCQYQLIEEEF